MLTAFRPGAEAHRLLVLHPRLRPDALLAPQSRCRRWFADVVDKKVTAEKAAHQALVKQRATQLMLIEKDLKTLRFVVTNRERKAITKRWNLPGPAGITDPMTELRVLRAELTKARDMFRADPAVQELQQVLLAESTKAHDRISGNLAIGGTTPLQIPPTPSNAQLTIPEARSGMPLAAGGLALCIMAGAVAWQAFGRGGSSKHTDTDQAPQVPSSKTADVPSPSSSTTSPPPAAEGSASPKAPGFDANSSTSSTNSTAVNRQQHQMVLYCAGAAAALVVVGVGWYLLGRVGSGSTSHSQVLPPSDTATLSAPIQESELGSQSLEAVYSAPWSAPSVPADPPSTDTVTSAASSTIAASAEVAQQSSPAELKAAASRAAETVFENTPQPGQVWDMAASVRGIPGGV